MDSRLIVIFSVVTGTVIYMLLVQHIFKSFQKPGRA